MNNGREVGESSRHHEAGQGEEDDDFLILEEDLGEPWGNQFLFAGQGSGGDRQNVLDAGKPWFFEKQLVVLKAITGDEVLSQVTLEEAPVWIQMYDIPLNHRTTNNVRNIPSKTGSFLCFDEKGEQRWSKFIWANVLLNVEKPLRKSLSIRKERGTIVEVVYRYEGIPNFCYLCGKLGHDLKECECRGEDSDDEENTSFDEWLCASPLKPYSIRQEASMGTNIVDRSGGANKKGQTIGDW
ncbi:hypothetical protein Tsubulata_033990 [Turnera subulata]|uniref:CCHC-type domain-containing protein n=1 Tax=Turnera subulata TaxID=218843 RepID=A0A9Q0GC83_9ROSI|nr:hypothetical protein Tsubulata_033990 [Turnera subulata]